MSDQDQTLVRVSRDKVKRLKTAAKRDGFSITKGLDLILEKTLPDIESGKVRFTAGINDKDAS